MEAARVYEIGLRTRFRGLTRRDGMLLRGRHGWGEFSPFWDYDPKVSQPWLLAAIEAADEGWPAPIRSRIPVNVTVPAVDPERAIEIVLASGGCTTAKVKVAEPGQNLQQDCNRVAAVREALGPSGAIRVDSNGAWDVPTALTALTSLDRAAGGLEYAEQPVASVEDLAAVRRATHVPIAADESIRRATDPLRVMELQAADIVVLKVQPLGGVRACLALAAQIDLPIVVSSALETEIGLAAGLALAAALPRLDFACGLATSQLLTASVTTVPLEVKDGTLPNGIGPVNETAWADAAAPAHLADRWFKRLAEVAATLPAAQTRDIQERWLSA